MNGIRGSALAHRDLSLYLQVEAILRDQIGEGGLKPGDRLPPEEELRGRFKVSRGTIRQALDALERDHLIERTPGRGTFVRGGSVQSGATAERLQLPWKHMIDTQAGSADRLVRHGAGPAPDVVERMLGIAHGADVPFLIRVSTGRGARIGLKRYLHPDLTSHIDQLASAPDWSAALRERAGGKVRTGAVWAEAMLAEPRFAMLLKVRAGSPLLSLWWVEKVARSTIACSQMLQQGSTAALLVSDG